MTPAELSPAGRQLYERMEHEDEDLLIEIRKHLIGLVAIYGTGGFVVLMLVVLAIVASAVLGGDAMGSDLGPIMPFIVACLLVLAGLGAVMTFISAYLYRSNVILVTTDKIAQILNPSLFNRKISQLSLGDIQDVTVTQQGIFPHIFNYGRLVIETSGEQDNYIFTYVPDPYKCSKVIINAHERNFKLYGN